MSMRDVVSTLVIVAAAGLAGPCGALADDGVTLKPMEKGASAKLGGYMPQRMSLTADKPETITKMPAEVTGAKFGVLPIASRGGEKVKFHVVLVETEGKPAQIWIDANGNGDMTDDPAVEWKGKDQEANGKKTTMYSGEGAVQIGDAKTPFMASINFYRFDPTDPARAALKDTVLYYRDYAMTGEATIGGKTYAAMLVDEKATGDFSGKAAEGTDPKNAPIVNLLLDVNGNGKFDRRGESFKVNEPFNISGTTYEITGLTAAGTSFKIVKSDKKVDEVPTPPDHGVGKKIMPFTATNMDGKEVKFPDDYKGKIVMLDFWATWCGPCMGEVPGLVKTYTELHSQGMEILGISLDMKDQAEKVKKVTGEKGMTWAQVYDGGYWKAKVAQMYAIDSIPATFLVDGDTGEILAVNSSLRGDKLNGTVAQALAKKKAGK